MASRIKARELRAPAQRGSHRTPSTGLHMKAVIDRRSKPYTALPYLHRRANTQDCTTTAQGINHPPQLTPFSPSIPPIEHPRAKDNRQHK